MSRQRKLKSLDIITGSFEPISNLHYLGSAPNTNNYIKSRVSKGSSYPHVKSAIKSEVLRCNIQS